MSQILAYSFIICAVILASIPVVGFIKSKYYYVDTTPIRYWFNKKQKTNKRYKSFKKRNKKYLNVNKINRFGSFNKYSKFKLTKVNK